MEPKTVIKKNFISIFIILSTFTFFTVTLKAAVTTPSVGDYATDAADQISRLDHSALEALETIDYMMCMMNARADLYPNANFRAKVDELKCDKLAGGDVDASEQPHVSDLWISCTHASAATSQICDIWFGFESPTAGISEHWLAQVESISAPTTARPNGEFIFSACKANATSGICELTDNEHMQLTVRVVDGVTNVQLYDSYTEDSDITMNDADGNAIAGQVGVDRLNIDLANHKLDSATGTLNAHNCGWDEAQSRDECTPKVFDVDFNGALALIETGNDGNPSCFDLDEPTEFPTQYDLYNKTTGVKKAVASGFPIKVKTSSVTGAVDSYGWLDNNGIWVDGGISLDDGDVVTVESGSVGGEDLTGIDLTFSTAVGILSENSSFTGTLDAKDAAAGTTARTTSTMSRWLPTGAGNSTKVGLYINTTDNKVYTTEDAVITGSSRTAPFDATAIVCNGQTTVQNYACGMESEAIGAWITISDVSTTPDTFTAYTHERITPALTTKTGTNFANDIVLKCFGSECPMPTTDGANPANGFSAAWFKAGVPHRDRGTNTPAGFSYFADVDPNGGSPRFYLMKASDMTLYYCGVTNADDCVDNTNFKVICDQSDANCKNGDNDTTVHFGVGGMVLAAALGTDDGAINSWTDVHALPQYRWNMSTNPFQDKLVMVKKSSDSSVVALTPPLQIAYTHAQANDRNNTATYAGRKYTLYYQGNGELHGFDWTQDIATKQWSPQISFLDGLELDTNADGTTDHVVLARRIEERMNAEGDTSLCTAASLSIATSATLPSVPSDLLTRIDFNWTGKDSLTYVSSSACVVDGVPQAGIDGCLTD